MIPERVKQIATGNKPEEFSNYERKLLKAIMNGLARGNSIEIKPGKNGPIVLEVRKTIID